MPLLKPTFLADFANSRQLDPRITFTRASGGAYFDRLGVLRQAAANQPRFDFDPVTLACRGLLIEEQRTNLFLQSGFAGAASGTPGTAPTSWTIQIVGAPSTEVLASVFGSADGAQAVKFNGASGDRAYYVQNVSITSGVTYSLSAEVEAASGIPRDVLFVVNGTGAATVLSTNADNPTPGRRTLVFTCTSTGTVGLRVGIGCAFAIAATSSATVSRPQLEAGAFPTSYIPTAASQVTRSADIANITGTNFSSFFNPAEGTFFADYELGAKNASIGIISASDGATTNVIQMRYASGSQAQFSVIAASVQVASLAAIGFSTASRYLRAVAYAENSFNQSIAGLLPNAEDTSGALPVVNGLAIGNEFGTNLICGHIRRIAYYPKRLTNAELQALSA
jgi:hypothetical protein